MTRSSTGLRWAGLVTALAIGVAVIVETAGQSFALARCASLSKEDRPEWCADLAAKSCDPEQGPTALLVGLVGVCGLVLRSLAPMMLNGQDQGPGRGGNGAPPGPRA